MANKRLIKNSEEEAHLRIRLRLQDNLKRFKDYKPKPLTEILTPEVLKLLRELELKVPGKID